MLGEEKHDVAPDLGDVDPKTCALIVIDELGDLAGTPNEALLTPPTDNTARLARAARAHGMPVIFANDAHIPGLDHELALWGDHGLADTPEAQPSPQLELQAGDFVIPKRRYSAFFQTGLLLLLSELGIKTLICTGFDTNICVRHTVADAYFNNIDCIVVADATATFLVGDQDDGLAYMKTCYASAIVSTEEALALVERA